ncbi:MAG: AraC family transcriptional regulator [Ruminococcaceae bacterium]|nr:AraC family transcriptional regulator [Oscillospiraceae bacterium]
MKTKRNSYPYQMQVYNDYNMSLSVSTLGKSVRNETGTWYFAPDSFYTLHYIESGEATFTQNGKSFDISANDIVIIYPENLSQLTVTKAPYINRWINFKGIDVLNLLSHTDININSPVFKPGISLAGTFSKIDNLQFSEPHSQAQILSVMYNIFSKIMKQSNKNTNTDNKTYYVTSFLRFIEENYSQNIQIPDIAKFVGLSASQLYRIVMNQFNVSPVEFLTSYRINKSKNYLKEKDMKISVIAKLCGYTDPQYFSKSFYKRTGMTPTEYREESKKRTSRNTNKLKA